MSLLKNLFVNSGLTSRGKLVHVKQAQPGNDGLACIVMLMNFHGKMTSLNELNNKYPDYISGINLRQIIDIFQADGLKTRPLQCPVSELPNLKAPAILHWDMKRFVVLANIGSQKMTILDPGSKKITFSEDEFEQHYAEIALEVFTSPVTQTRK